MIHTVVIEGEHTGPVVTENIKTIFLVLYSPYSRTLFYSYQSCYQNNLDQRIPIRVQEQKHLLSVNFSDLRPPHRHPL